MRTTLHTCLSEDLAHSTAGSNHIYPPLVVASGVAVLISVVGLLTVLPVVALVVVSVAIIVVVCNGTSRRSADRFQQKPEIKTVCILIFFSLLGLVIFI